MLINEAKTGLMCVPAATSFRPKVTIDLAGTAIAGSPSMKVLGLTLDSNFSFNSHVRSLCSRMRSHTWTLLRLKRAGLTEEGLINTYKTLIRPLVEYVSPVWHPIINASQSVAIERQQTQALMNIYGPNMSARKMRNKVDLKTL